MGEELFYIGVLQLTVVFLSIMAGGIALSLFRISSKHDLLGAWPMVIVALVLFAIVEIVGVLDAFDIYRQIAWMRHVIPSLIMGCLIIGVVRQIQITRVDE